jgi:Bacteriocin-protection, YdeI or OmpD-Associated
VPPDLAAALDHHGARAAFESLGRSEPYAVILPLLTLRPVAV